MLTLYCKIVFKTCIVAATIHFKGLALRYLTDETAAITLAKAAKQAQGLHPNETILQCEWISLDEYNRLHTTPQKNKIA